jgi:shikimate dehydrogenase
VLGAPIAHSRSPVLHRAAYTWLHLPWRYDAIRVEHGELARFVAGLDSTWRGLSLTMPLKTEALALADEASDLARAVGAANTLLLEPGGLLAHTTDVPGIAAALAEHGVAHVPRAVVLGGGATAASAVAALGPVADEVLACVRTASRAEQLHAVAEALGVHLIVEDWDAAPALLDAPVVVATTPAGATDALAPVVPVTPGVLLEVVYHPWPTALAAAWDGAGGRVASGLDLLVHQAAGQVALMTGHDVPVAVLRAALEPA